MKCAECSVKVVPHEVVWLREDCVVVCAGCHEEDVDSDPFDRYDHGTPYRAREVAHALDH